MAIQGITLRQDKGSDLTPNEADQNFIRLKQAIEAIQTSFTDGTRSTIFYGSSAPGDRSFTWGVLDGSGRVIDFRRYVGGVWASILPGRIYPTADSSGPAGALTATLPEGPNALVPGQLFLFRPAIDNAANATLNLGGLGARPLKTDGAAIQVGQMRNGRLYLLVLDGTDISVINPQQPSTDLTPMFASAAAPALAFGAPVSGVERSTTSVELAFTRPSGASWHYIDARFASSCRSANRNGKPEITGYVEFYWASGSGDVLVPVSSSTGCMVSPKHQRGSDGNAFPIVGHYQGVVPSNLTTAELLRLKAVVVLEGRDVSFPTDYSVNDTRFGGKVDYSLG